MLLDKIILSTNYNNRYNFIDELLFNNDHNLISLIKLYEGHSNLHDYKCTFRNNIINNTIKHIDSNTNIAINNIILNTINQILTNIINKKISKNLIKNNVIKIYDTNVINMINNYTEYEFTVTSCKHYDNVDCYFGGYVSKIIRQITDNNRNTNTHHIIILGSVINVIRKLIMYMCNMIIDPMNYKKIKTNKVKMMYSNYHEKLILRKITVNHIYQNKKLTMFIKKVFTIN